MSTLLCAERKSKLCERAKKFHHANIYGFRPNWYAKGGWLEPDCNDEPIVCPEGLYDLDTDSSWLTVNDYNALVLNTRNMLIVDKIGRAHV